MPASGLPRWPLLPSAGWQFGARRSFPRWCPSLLIGRSRRHLTVAALLPCWKLLFPVYVLIPALLLLLFLPFSALPPRCLCPPTIAPLASRPALGVSSSFPLVITARRPRSILTFLVSSSSCVRPVIWSFVAYFFYRVLQPPDLNAYLRPASPCLLPPRPRSFLVATVVVLVATLLARLANPSVPLGTLSSSTTPPMRMPRLPSRSVTRAGSAFTAHALTATSSASPGSGAKPVCAAPQAIRLASGSKLNTPPPRSSGGATKIC